MFFCIVYLSHLLQSSRPSDYLAHPLVRLNYRFVSILVHLAPEVVQKLFVVDPALTIVTFYQIIRLILTEKNFTTLQSPPKIIAVQHSNPIRIQTTQHFMQKSHPVYPPLSQQMFHLLLKSKFIDYLPLDYRFVKLLASIRCPQNKP